MIDLRSDVCVLPTRAMWEAMRSADLGWALLGEDASVNRLERLGARLLGKEGALLTTTCGQANLVALLTLAAPGEEVWVGRNAHIITSEGMGVIELARLRTRLLEDAEGAPRLDTEAGLLCLENTHTRAGGRVLRPERIAALAARARWTYLDGARLPNAAVALGISLAELAAPAAMVALSLNKGLGAPFGALLAGSAALIEQARQHLRRIGGASVHRAGIMAAAALVALEGFEERIAADHRRAARLAELIGAPRPETNIVLHDVPGPVVPWLERLAAAGVLAYPHPERRVRFVTHAGVDDAAVARAAALIAAARP